MKSKGWRLKTKEDPHRYGPVDMLGTVWAVDVTIPGRFASRGAENAEKVKARKCFSYFKERKNTAFYPFALTLEGEGGPSTRRLCASLAIRMANSPSNGLNLSGAWRSIIRGWQMASRVASADRSCAV